MVRPRVRIRFSKQSALSLIGHRDLMRSLERLFRRAGLSLGMSEGYRPKPRMNFPLALAVGIEGRREVMELELNETPTADELLARLQSQALPGLRFESLEVLPPGGRKAHAVSASYEIAIPQSRLPGLEAAVQGLRSASSCMVRRPNRSAPIDLCATLLGLALQGDTLEMRLKTDPGGSAGPRDVLAALGLEDLEHDGIALTRTDVEIDS
jgi:radical SAM-linked protein